MAISQVSDEATTRAMLAQYSTTLETFQTAHRAIDTMMSTLRTQWKSDASLIMDNGLRGWLEGFQILFNNVVDMQDAMNSYDVGNQMVTDSDLNVSSSWANATPSGAS